MNILYQTFCVSNKSGTGQRVTSDAGLLLSAIIIVLSIASLIVGIFASGIIGTVIATIIGAIALGMSIALFIYDYKEAKVIIYKKIYV